MSDWRPIETAPKDGTHVILWVPFFMPQTVREKLGRGYGAVLAGGWNSWEKVWALEIGGSCVGPKYMVPTHWMPLPDPPQ